jgi:hypothetical protein
MHEAITAPGAAQQRSRTDDIEEALYAHRRSLFGELAVAFFDITTLSSEGRGGATLGRRGHSKDFRIDYILGVRERSSAEVRERVLEDDGVAVPLVIPRQKGETE